MEPLQQVSRSLQIVIVQPFRKPAINFFFFNDPAPTEIYPLSLHDALPIPGRAMSWRSRALARPSSSRGSGRSPTRRSEEHTSELQSPCNIVCRLLREKKNRWRPPVTSSRQVRSIWSSGTSRRAPSGAPNRARLWVGGGGVARPPLRGALFLFVAARTPDRHTLALHHALPI